MTRFLYVAFFVITVASSRVFYRQESLGSMTGCDLFSADGIVSEVYI